MGGALASIGKFKLGVIAAGVAVVALGVKMGISAVKAAAAFEQGMARVKAVTGATGKAFKALEDEAKRLGKVTKFTMVEISAGLETLGRAGFTTIELVEAMGGVTALASSQMMSLAEAGEITANILRAMQIPALDANRVVNMLAAAAASSNTTVQSLGESFKMIAPLAAALGTPVEELGAIIGKLGDVGFRGTMATSTLATALSRLAAPPAEATRALDELGMSIWDAQGEFIGFTNMIRELEERFVGLTTQQKQAYLGMIFGRRAIKQITALIGIGADKLEEYTESITGTNAAFEQQAIMLDTLSGRWVILKSSVDLLLMTLGTPSLDTMSNLTTAITDVVNTITEWKESTGAVTDAIGEMGDEAEGAEKKIISLSDRILDLTGGMVNLKGVIFGVMNAIRFIWDLTFGAIVAALKIVMNYLLTIIRFLQGDWKGVWEAQKKMFQAFADYFLTIFRDLGISFKDFIDDIKNWWSGMWLGLKRDMTSFVNFFVAQINKIISLINMIPLLPDVTKMGLLEVPTAPPEPGEGVAGMLEAGRAATQAMRAAREAARAARVPVVEEIATCIGDVCTVTEELTDEMGTCADAVERVVEELSPFELALQAITVADVIGAPAKMAAELRKLGEQDIVAAAARTQELIRAMEAEIDALVLFGMETAEMEGYLKAFQEALSGPVSALEMIEWADVLAAPIKTAEKLAQLAAEDAVAVAGYTDELIGAIEAEIDARKMFGMETEETAEALALFRETIAGVIKEATLWEKVEEFLGEFGSAVSKGISQLFGEAGGLAYGLFTGLVSGMTGKGWGALASAAVDTFITVVNAAAAEAKRLTEAVKETADWIGKQLIRSFDWLVDKAQGLAQSFEKLITSTETYSKLQTTLSQIQSKVIDLLLGFLWPVIAILQELFGILTEATEAAAVEIGVPRAWKRARRAYEAAAPGEPYVPAMPGLPAWLVDIIEKFRAAIDAVLEPFKKFVNLLVKAWEALTPLIFEAILPAFKAFGEGLLKLAQAIWDNIELFKTYLPGSIKNALDFFFGAITGVATFFVDTLTDLLPNLSLFFEQLGIFGDLLPGLFSALSDALSPVFATLIDAFTGVLAWVNTVLAPDLKAFFTAFGDWWRTDVDPFLQKELFPTLGRWLTALYEWIKNDLLPFLKNEVWPALKNDIWPVVKAAFEGLGKALGDLWNTIKENMPTVTAFLTTFIENITGKWTGMVETLNAYILLKSGDLMGALKIIWESGSLSLWNKLKMTFALGAMVLWDWMRVKLQPLWDAFGRLWNAISPVLIPALQFLGGILAGAFTVAVNTLTYAISLLAFAINVIISPFQWLAGIIKSVCDWFSNLLGGGNREWVSTGQGEGYWKAPSFQLGGVIPGPIGAPRLARVEGGEEVLTYAQRNQRQSVQVFNEIRVYLGQDEVTDLIAPNVIERIRHTSKLLTGSRSTAAGLTRRAYA